MGVDSATLTCSSGRIAVPACFLPWRWTAQLDANAQVIGGGEVPASTFHARCGTGLAYSFIPTASPRWGGPVNEETA
jgi:hypothetical protein